MRTFPHLRVARWLLPVGALLTLAGYFGPWVPHRAAGLVIVGLDLGEYVKFLVPVQSGAISVWREGFYLPLVAVSLALSLYAFRPEFAYRTWLRALLLFAAVVAALNLLPPAWSPAVLSSGEFRLQVVALGLCLGAMLISPLLALMPRLVAALLVTALAAAALLVPALQFLRVLPAIADLYAQALRPGWGFWLMPVGLLLLAGAALLPLLARPAPTAESAIEAAPPLAV